MTFDELERQVLELPVGDRARLARDIVRSFKGLREAEIESLWLDEAQRRDQEMTDSGDEGVSGPEVIEEARRRLS